MERSWGLLENLRSHLEASSAILSHLGAHLGLSEALLEPSWAILDALTARGAPRPGPGEGVGGGVNPSPKGKKEVGRGNSLNHLRPEGWWDYPIAPRFRPGRRERAVSSAGHFAWPPAACRSPRLGQGYDTGLGRPTWDIAFLACCHLPSNRHSLGPLGRGVVLYADPNETSPTLGAVNCETVATFVDPLEAQRTYANTIETSPSLGP